MELKYIVMTIIKILISVPAVVLIYSLGVDAAALMGGHLNNSSAMNITSLFNNLDLDNGGEVVSSEIAKRNKNVSTTEHVEPPVSSNEAVEDSEEIPDPSPLVVPGYNLPDNIFNKGKPFYLEKDPLTGQVNFDSKLSSVRLDDDLYDYVEDEPSSDIYDKSNIDRKDGSLSSHKPSDVNQLTPNFHDFLNLPVKYNSEKYVYPLISSSYANTKIQGNVNKYHNHKTYNVKPSTYKPTSSPTYYISTKEQPFGNKIQTKNTIHTTTTQRTTTTRQPTTKVQSTISTTEVPNLLNSPINHPSFNEEFSEDFHYYEVTSKKKPNEIYLTTEDVNRISITTKPSPSATTKRPLSLFEQLFGDYDETVTTTEGTKSPSLFSNLPNNKNKYYSEVKTEKNYYTTSSSTQQNTYTTSSISQSNAHGGPGMLSEVSGMGVDNSYEYEEEYPLTSDDNIATDTKILVSPADETPTKSNSKLETTTPKIIKEEIPSIDFNSQEVSTMSSQTSYKSTQNTSPSTVTRGSTTTATTKMTKISAETTPLKVTSLPLGENHVTSLNNRQPIIVATQNIRDQLNNEKIIPKPFGYNNPVIHDNAPSTSNIHIAHDQDTVSFVMGHHQSVDGGQYVGTALKESPYDSNPFRPFYGQQGQYNKDTSAGYTVQMNPQVYKPVQNFPEVAGSAVTIQPLKNSEASLAIGVPVNSINKKPGQVVDEKLEINNENIEFPKGNGPKVVFPDEKEPESTNLVPPPPKRKISPQIPLPPKSEVLNLNSKPMYHQLPSDLTPPKEQNLVPPPRMDRPRPPWDPRPGHFYSGKPEYARPPRPDIAYKRIDNLPNILPQFRPNMKIHQHGPPHHFDRLNRQPLLERPSNRPIGFFEQLHPPPPPKNLHNLRKIPPLPPNQSLDQRKPSPDAEDRIMNEAPHKAITEQFGLYQTPPKVPIANRRISEDDGEVETLQMIQAKNAEKKNVTSDATDELASAEEDDKSLYVVYPVNTGPLKMDVIDSTKKETVVIGTRAELPLPPSKINQQLSYDQNPIFNTKERNDSPILKPHPKPPTFPIKSDFPYPLERPDPSILNPPVPDIPSNSANLDELNTNFDIEPTFISSNQWNTIGENIDKQKVSTQTNQISATLKTYTEKPIAVAYTPTEPHRKYNPYDDRFSMPNYGGSVIPEIRPDEIAHKHPDGTVHAYPYIEIQHRKDEMYKHKIIEEKPVKHPYQNHRIEPDVSPKLEFQAPFQASASIDQSKSQGWSVVRDKKMSSTENPEGTTLPLATTGEFDIENFKPQLEGGFKPIYTLSNDTDKLKGIDRIEK